MYPNSLSPLTWVCVAFITIMFLPLLTTHPARLPSPWGEILVALLAALHLRLLCSFPNPLHLLGGPCPTYLVAHSAVFAFARLAVLQAAVYAVLRLIGLREWTPLWPALAVYGALVAWDHVQVWRKYGWNPPTWQEDGAVLEAAEEGRAVDQVEQEKEGTKEEQRSEKAQFLAVKVLPVFPADKADE